MSHLNEITSLHLTLHNNFIMLIFQNDFTSQVKAAGGKLILIDFHALWCGPCKMIAPELAKMAVENPDVVFLKVDVDEVDELAQEYGISAMPTFIFLKNGEKVWLLEIYFIQFLKCIDPNSSKVAELCGASAPKLRELVQQHKWIWMPIIEDNILKFLSIFLTCFYFLKIS